MFWILLSVILTRSYAESCAGMCGNGHGYCWCTEDCACYGDCCSDFYLYCTEAEDCVHNKTYNLTIRTVTPSDGTFYVSATGQAGDSSSITLMKDITMAAGIASQNLEIISSIGSVLSITLSSGNVPTANWWVFDAIWLNGTSLILDESFSLCYPNCDSSHTFSLDSGYIPEDSGDSPEDSGDNTEDSGGISEDSSDISEDSGDSSDAHTGDGSGSWSSCSVFCGDGTRFMWDSEGEMQTESCNLGSCEYYVVEKESPFFRCDGDAIGEDEFVIKGVDTVEECEEDCDVYSPCNFMGFNTNLTNCRSYKICVLEQGYGNNHYFIQGKMLEGTVLLSSLNKDLECLNITTPRTYLYQYPIWVDKGSNYATFTAVSNGNLYVALGNTSEHNGTYWEIAIVSWSDDFTAIRDISGTIIAEYHGRIIGQTTYWISWSSNSVSVGFGNIAGVGMFMSGTSSENTTINLIGISTDSGGTGTWVFGCGNNQTMVVTWIVQVCCLSGDIDELAPVTPNIAENLGLSADSVRLVTNAVSTPEQTYDLEYEIVVDWYTATDLTVKLKDDNILASLLEVFAVTLSQEISEFETLSVSMTEVTDSPSNDSDDIVCLDEASRVSVDNLLTLVRRDKSRPCFSDSDCEVSCEKFLCEFP